MLYFHGFRCWGADWVAEVSAKKIPWMPREIYCMIKVERKKNFFSKYNDKKKLRPTRAQRPNPRANEKRSKMKIHSKSASSDIHARWTVLREDKVENCGRGKTARARDDDGKEARGKITRKRAFLWINHFHSPGKCAENYLWEWAPFMCPFYLKVGRESLY